MALVDNPELAPTKPEQTPIEIYKEPYRGVTVDTRYEPLASLMTAIEGSPWTVNYYSQVLGRDSSLQGQQAGLDPVYQQYIKIVGMVMKVTAPLERSITQDPASKEMEIRGSATVFPFLIPNNGDMFVADIGSGAEGVFRIIHSERRSIMKSTCYTIDYVLVEYSNPTRIGDLERKTQKKVYYLKDFMEHGQNPLVSEEDYHHIQSLEGRYYDLIDLYYELVHSTEFRTLLIPGQDLPTYDHFLTKAVGQFFDSRLNPRILQTRILNVDGDLPMTTLTVWDALVKRDRKLMKNIAKRMGTQSAKIFARKALYEGIYFSGISKLTYPIDPVIRVDNNYRGDRHTAQTGGLVPSRGYGELPTQPDPEIPITIKSVLVDDFYIFSEAFYTKAASGQSLLELQTNDYLDSKALNNGALMKLADECQSWPMLEFYYYVPILLILIKASIRSV